MGLNTNDPGLCLRLVRFPVTKFSLINLPHPPPHLDNVNFFQSQILTSLPFSPITIEKHSNELRHPTLYHRPLVVSCLDLQKGIACY